ncbi:hypothetical protein HCB37_16735 [Listeria booriae]|uniref:hypothetical protein n=1 Tax=Listeria booriae TaxID=1552123 RepID=UPI0016244291|nr:hypothetical protein [Listeria booriae]MBC1899103.1 hypothetical protein [Listeria booriae]MBC2266150.1 hypothetical protein [Listeria booriae]
MIKLFKVNTDDGNFYVKAESAELAKKHIIDIYGDCEESYVLSTIGLILQEAKKISVSDEDGKEFSNLGVVFEESTRNPDILTVPACLL